VRPQCRLPAKRIALVVVVVGLLAWSCSFDYGSDVETSALARGVPDLSMKMARHTVIRDGVLLMTIEANDIRVYTSENRREFKGLSFTQYDRAGNILAEGNAGSAVQAVDTENIDFADGLEIRVLKENTLIRTTALSWNADAKVFSGKMEDEVLLRRGDTTEIYGTGLRIDAENRQLEFQGAVHGTLAD